MRGLDMESGIERKPLRVIDFGTVPSLRSQTLWHAIARGVSDGAPATLSFMTPSAPYVSIGLHRSLAEVDQTRCDELGLPIYRRHVGGGPVYLDSGQLFFQITVPASDAPAIRATAVQTLLTPAVEAFRNAGVDAMFDAAGEIVVGDRKICGHGAGQIGSAVIVVGNLIRTFDHRTAAATISTPNDHAREEVERLMRRYVAPTPVDSTAFREAAIQAYENALEMEAQPGELNENERQHLDELDDQFLDEEWVAGRPRPGPNRWMVKIKSGVFVGCWSDGDDQLTLSVDHGTILTAHVHDAGLNGDGADIERVIEGRSVAEAKRHMADLGWGAGRVLRLLEQVPEVAPQ